MSSPSATMKSLLKPHMQTSSRGHFWLNNFLGVGGDLVICGDNLCGGLCCVRGALES